MILTRSITTPVLPPTVHQDPPPSHRDTTVAARNEPNVLAVLVSEAVETEQRRRQVDLREQERLARSRARYAQD